MKRKKITAMIMTVTFAATVFTGCGTKSEKMNDNSSSAMTEDNITQNNETETIGTETTEKETEAERETGTSVFSALKNYYFEFASGAGGWNTTLTIQPDGSFSGQYHDSEMGVTGEDYPNGTMDQCVFHGMFTQPVARDTYTYQFRIDSIEYDKEPGTEEIIDGVKYIYTDVYGLEDAEEIYLYLPDIPVAELPQEYLDWIYRPDKTQNTLGTYGLYNLAAKEGFTSYKINEEASDIDAELSALEEEAQKINNQLQSGELSQGDMNQLSYELYQLWDNELNSLWNRLKEKLDADAMKQLTEEEREWIQWKDKEVETAGLEAEGGSLQPLLENDKAAELTRDRVYELAEKLKND